MQGNANPAQNDNNLQRMTPMTTNPINVEEIMHQIRTEILAQKQAQVGGQHPAVRLHGRRFAPEFYEYLYQATLSYDQLQVQMQVQKSAVPLFGPLLDKVKMALHQLVIFYVQQVAAQQMVFNKQILGALSSLSAELDDELEQDTAA